MSDVAIVVHAVALILVAIVITGTALAWRDARRGKRRH